MPDGQPGNENTEVHLEQMSGAYKRSKFEAEQVAMEFARSGFPVVIVNPTAPIGDHDFKLHRQAPAIGEHTAEVLAELGLAQNEIDALSQRSIVTVGESR